jgi:uncharacterized NAD(P)/FAD-binding protein YdhS
MLLDQVMDIVTVAIVGGGASGVLTAAHILRQAALDVRVVLIEPRDLGAGAAYASDAPEHRLNVRASGMSAYHDDPGHFARWINEQGIDDPQAFVSRGLYRPYLLAVLEEAIDGRAGIFEHRQDTVQRITDCGGTAELELETGARIRASRAVLALGNMIPRDPPIETPWFYSEPGYIRTPWTASLDQIGPKDEVMIVGTGLTAVDVFLTLEGRRHRGRVTAVSRHGKWPYPHGPAARREFTLDINSLPSNMPRLLRAVRDGIEQAAAVGVPWQHVIDALRPVCNALWERASAADRRQFMRHLTPIWNAARHRIPQEAYEALTAAARRSQLRTVAGQLRRVDRLNHILAATVILRDGGQFRSYPKWIVNCTGPNGDLRASPSALVRQLLADGTAVPNALNQGFETDSNGALVNVLGQRSDVLYTLGPMRRGNLIETTAINEIRQQAASLARILVNEGPKPIPVL